MQWVTSEEDLAKRILQDQHGRDESVGGTYDASQHEAAPTMSSDRIQLAGDAQSDNWGWSATSRRGYRNYPRFK